MLWKPEAQHTSTEYLDGGHSYPHVGGSRTGLRFFISLSEKASSDITQVCVVHR